MKKKWVNNDDLYLINHYGKGKKESLIQNLNTSWHSIQSRASKLKLKRIITKIKGNEINFRMEWLAAVDTLQKLVDPVSKHNRKCCEFWYKNLNKASEILLIMDNGKSYKIIRPNRKEAKQEAYLAYGIDFHECETINFTK